MGRSLDRQSTLKLKVTIFGELAERPKAAVLKTVEEKSSGGSNPSLSAINESPLKGAFFMAESEGGENPRGSTKMPGAFLDVRRTARRAKTMDGFRNPSQLSSVP